MKSVKPKWLADEARIIEHMNNDHSNSIVSTLNAQHGIKDTNARMKSLAINGYYVSSGKDIFFISFGTSCSTTAEYKDELIRQAKKNRKFEIAKAI